MGRKYEVQDLADDAVFHLSYRAPVALEAFDRMSSEFNLAENALCDSLEDTRGG